jgi:hypothetical protein
MLTFPPSARLGKAHRGGRKRKQSRGFGLAAHPSYFEEMQEENQHSQRCGKYVFPAGNLFSRPLVWIG